MHGWNRNVATPCERSHAHMLSHAHTRGPDSGAVFRAPGPRTGAGTAPQTLPKPFVAASSCAPRGPRCVWPCPLRQQHTATLSANPAAEERCLEQPHEHFSDMGKAEHRCMSNYHLGPFFGGGCWAPYCFLLILLLAFSLHLTSVTTRSCSHVCVRVANVRSPPANGPVSFCHFGFCTCPRLGPGSPETAPP